MRGRKRERESKGRRWKRHVSGGGDGKEDVILRRKRHIRRLSQIRRKWQIRGG